MDELLLLGDQQDCQVLNRVAKTREFLSDTVQGGPAIPHLFNVLLSEERQNSLHCRMILLPQHLHQI